MNPGDNPAGRSKMVMMFTWQSITCEWNQAQSVQVDLSCYPLRLLHQHHSLTGDEQYVSGISWRLHFSLTERWSEHTWDAFPNLRVKNPPIRTRGIKLLLSERAKKCSLSGRRIQKKKIRDNMENKMHYNIHFGLKPKLETKMRLVHSCISCVSRIKLHYVMGKE